MIHHFIKRSKIIILSIFIIFYMSCGGSSAPHAPDLNPPSNIKVYWSPSISNLSFSLQWVNASTGVDWYEVEAKIGSGQFVGFPGNTVIQTGYQGTYFTILGVPECTDIWVHMRAVRNLSPNNIYSAYSTPIYFRYGLKSPSISTPLVTANGIVVTWTNNSLIPDTLTVRRWVSFDGGTSWDYANSSLIPGISFGMTQCIDTTAPANTTVEYEVKYSKGNDFGLATSLWVKTGPA